MIYRSAITPIGRGRRAAGAWILAFLLAMTGTAAAQGPGERKVPRFTSLRAAEANLRTGPGIRYPVEWVFVRRGMPVEVIAEFDTWRKIRDWEGTEGWVHQSLLSGRRMVVVTGQVREMRRRPVADAEVIARIEADVIGRLLECERAWCRVEIAGFRGWLKRDEFWGVYANETVD